MEYIERFLNSEGNKQDFDDIIEISIMPNNASRDDIKYNIRNILDELYKFYNQSKTSFTEDQVINLINRYKDNINIDIIREEIEVMKTVVK